MRFLASMSSRIPYSSSRRFYVLLDFARTCGPISSTRAWSSHSSRSLRVPTSLALEQACAASLLSYFSFGVFAFVNSSQKADVIHGGCLNAIVGTQSLVILGSAVAPDFGSLSPTVFVLVHIFWGIGLGLYGTLIPVLAHRLFFREVDPDDVTPILWVVMGAAAITANAGFTLVESETGIAFLDAMRPLINGVSLLMWAWGTSWIPFLLMLGLWKHGIRRRPLVYSPSLWSLVFPLGMYAVASFRLSLVADFTALQRVAEGMTWVASVLGLPPVWH